MKNCPTCGANYMDRVDFCFDDGAVLTDLLVEGISVDGGGGLDIDAPMPRNLTSTRVLPRPVTPSLSPSTVPLTPVPSPVAKRPTGHVLGEKGPAPMVPHSGVLTGNEFPNAETKPPPIQREDVSAVPLLDSVEFEELEEDEEERSKAWLFIGGAAITTVVGLSLIAVFAFTGAGLYLKNAAGQGGLPTDVPLDSTPDAIAGVLEQGEGNADEEPNEEGAPDADAVPDATTDTLRNVDLSATAPTVASPSTILREPAADALPAIAKSSKGNIPLTLPAQNLGAPSANGAAQKASLTRPISDKGAKNVEAPAGQPAPVKPFPGSQSEHPAVHTDSVVKPESSAVIELPEVASAPVVPVQKESVPKVALRSVNVLVRLPGNDGQVAVLSVDGVKQSKSGQLWPLRLQITEGAHTFVVTKDGQEESFKKTIDYKPSMLILSLE